LKKDLATDSKDIASLEKEHKELNMKITTLGANVKQLQPGNDRP